MPVPIKSHRLAIESMLRNQILNKKKYAPAIIEREICRFRRPLLKDRFPEKPFFYRYYIFYRFFRKPVFEDLSPETGSLENRSRKWESKFESLFF